MILIAVVDDSGGMMFNRRRQSQDRVLREKILSLTEKSCLWMNDYTAKQFADYAAKIHADNDFTQKADAGEYCFVENTSVSACADRIEKVILFKWNRAYPADFFFDLDLSAPEWKLLETEDFPGFSHEKITKEVYVHENR